MMLILAVSAGIAPLCSALPGLPLPVEAIARSFVIVLSKGEQAGSPFELESGRLALRSTRWRFREEWRV